MTPPVSWFASASLVVCLTSAGGHRPATVGDPVESVALELLIDAASSAGSFEITARFSFRVRAPDADLFFFFPGVADAAALRVVELNGRTIDNSTITRAKHPGLNAPAFRLRVQTTNANDVQTLVVTGPRVAMTPDGIVKWGGWHPSLRWDATVPITLRVRADTALDVIASGTQTGTTADGHARISTWRSSRPEGWVFLAIGRYVRNAVTRDGMTIEIAHPDSAAAGDTLLFTRAFHVLDYLSARFGRTGISQFRVIAFPSGETHRFAHDGLVALSTQSFEPARRSAEYWAAVLAHEFAHYWWGDLVRAEGPGEAWLTEGLAEYSRHLYERSIRGDTLAWGYRNLLAVSRFSDGSTPPSLAATQRQPGSDETVYQKGTFVFRMLEDLIGPAPFADALRDVVAAGRAGPMTLETFERLVEQRAARRLDWFFDQWVERATGPVLALEDVNVVVGGDRVTLTGIVRQAPPAYQLDLPMRVQLDSAVVDTVMPVRDTLTRFAIALPRRPRHLVLDPDNRLFKWYSIAQLPITFADAWTRAAGGATLRLEHDRGTMSDSVVAAFQQFLDARFGAAADSSRTTRATGGRVLMGNAAMRYREAAVRWLEDAPAPGELRTYIARDTADARSVVIGVEGEWPVKWPEVIPQVPWREIRYRNGRMVGASAPPPPRIEIWLDKHR